MLHLAKHNFCEGPVFSIISSSIQMCNPLIKARKNQHQFYEIYTTNDIREMQFTLSQRKITKIRSFTESVIICKLCVGLPVHAMLYNLV